MAGTKRSKVKKNDQVVIIAGRDKGRRGRVLEVLPAKGKVKVEGAGIIKRHQKANPQANRGGGIVDKESFINISNVQFIALDLVTHARALPDRERWLEDARRSGQWSFIREVVEGLTCLQG